MQLSKVALLFDYTCVVLDGCSSLGPFGQPKDARYSTDFVDAVVYLQLLDQMNLIYGLAVVGQVGYALVG